MFNRYRISNAYILTSDKVSKELSASTKSLSESTEWFIEVYIDNRCLIIILYFRPFFSVPAVWRSNGRRFVGSNGRRPQREFVRKVETLFRREDEVDRAWGEATPIS